MSEGFCNHVGQPAVKFLPETRYFMGHSVTAYALQIYLERLPNFKPIAEVQRVFN